ncbi:signal peptidase II [Spectribacter hydrogenoxidans]|uniref:Signal peptidase II n=1 Tax=Spectribacter hydrogenoxidans TaxID=3075608 RepID=A0ABU3C3I3_9GAMM|nr:signal peptidase II [Salinisphaera sp. W335]MDT0635946.1 signal peptidase II [Salinisphaera sp. W335]
MTETPNNRPMRRTLPLLLAAALLAAGTDLATKSWAQAMLAGQPPLPLLGETLRLHLGFNTGVAFSLFAGGGLFVPLLNLAVLSGFCVWLGLLLRRQSLGPRGLLKNPTHFRHNTAIARSRESRRDAGNG